MGKSETFDDAMASFAMAYTAQNQKDYNAYRACAPAESDAKAAAG